MRIAGSLIGFRQLRKDLPAITYVPLTWLSDAQSARRTCQEPNAEMRLEFVDSASHCRRRHVQLTRRARKTVSINNCHENVDEVEPVHCCTVRKSVLVPKGIIKES